MTIEYIRYSLTTHTPDELTAAYTAAAAHLQAAPECQAFELTQCEDDANSFILRIEWTSTEAHLNGFRKGPNFPPFFSAIRDFIPEITEMRHYRTRQIQWRLAKSG